MIFLGILPGILPCNQTHKHVRCVQFPVKYSSYLDTCFIFAISITSIKKARQRESATKSGNGHHKTCNLMSGLLFLLFLFSLNFLLLSLSVVIKITTKPVYISISGQERSRFPGNEPDNEVATCPATNA